MARVDAEPRGALHALFGPLAALVAETAVTDVFVNPDGSVWADRGGGAERDPRLTLTGGESRDLAVGLLARGGRHVDDATPCADVSLGDGVRVHAVLPPLSPGQATLSIRLPRPAAPTIDELDRSAFLPAGARPVIERLVARRANLLVTGAAGSGKTTLLAAILATAPPSERIVVVEDVAELRIRHPHVVALQARQPNLEGAGGVGLDRLVREALRMRPDRLVVGECRGVEIRELLGALNTGHDGGAGTLHANSLRDVAARLEALGALAGMSRAAVARQAASALDAVLHVERSPTGRRLAAIGEVDLDHRGRMCIRPLAIDP